MKLLVDIGNRRLKWAATGDGGDIDGRAGAFEYADAPDGLPGLAAQLDSLERPASVWASCVARSEIKQAVVEYARGAWSLEPVFIAAQKQQAGIVNGYPDPAALGSDRWAALIAAGNLFPRQPLIVVDAGTAVTVDLLDGDGTFRGGVIFPGVHAMRTALGEQTENIAGGMADDKPRAAEPVNAIATDTAGAVAGGALLAVAGGINLALARQRAALPADPRACCRTVATGGDAERIAPLLETEVSIEPQLVLKGLAVIAREAAR